MSLFTFLDASVDVPAQSNTPKRYGMSLSEILRPVRKWRDCSLSRVSEYEGNRRTEEIAYDCPTEGTEAWQRYVLAPGDRKLKYQRIEHSDTELGIIINDGTVYKDF
jgi:hypothetical protein